jgi:hypothetical protein
MYASEGLSGSIPEQLGCRFHTQEGEDGLVGEDDLPMFVQEDQDIGNRIEDLLEKRDARKSLVLASNIRFGGSLRGSKLGVYHLGIPAAIHIV